MLSSARVLLAGANPSGVETLKNLILPGIKEFVVLDNGKVEKVDLGNNFFVAEEDLGLSKAAAVTTKLAELNPDVKGSHLDIDIKLWLKE